MPGVNLVGKGIIKNFPTLIGGPGGGAKLPRPGVPKFGELGGQFL